jgi:hypothetical protein
MTRLIDRIFEPAPALAGTLFGGTGAAPPAVIVAGDLLAPALASTPGELGEELGAEPGAERRSREKASRGNHWHGTGGRCEDIVGGRLRSVAGDRVVAAIVPRGPAFADSTPVS